MSRITIQFLYRNDVRNDATILAWHEDWSAAVTVANPAVAGELIHLNATGLGDTSPAVPFGLAAPSVEPLARLTTSFTCTTQIGAKTLPLSSTFQGLEGGLAGVGQIDVRLPAETLAGRLDVQCSRAGGASVFGLVPTGDPP